MLQIYNSLTQQKESFKPIHPGKIGIYVCGMTVYDYCHIGHGRVMVAFDVITRYLRACGYEVNYVRNITDIDDKIIQRASQNSEPYQNLTARFIEAMHEDERSLNVLSPNHEPRATLYIDHIIHLIQRLLEKNFAYIADNGDIYYAVNEFAAYGELAHQELEKLRSGIRVAINEAKRDPLDFVLWKIAKSGEPSWNSPWGAGRPGWHIECSAMSLHCLGDHFDIHGGGFDLTFPHHQNEIAQSEGVTGQKVVNTWMHVGFVQINKEKMSKSLGNFFTIREVLQHYSPEVVRYFMLTSQYRSPLNYSTELLEHARSALERLYGALRGFELNTENSQTINNIYSEQFHQAMQDDFNTPEALAALFDLAREINRLRQSSPNEASLLAQQLVVLGNILGILQKTPEEFLREGIQPQVIQEIENLIKERAFARTQKDWARADALRQQLERMGIAIEDSPTETVWRHI